MPVAPTTAEKLRRRTLFTEVAAPALAAPRPRLRARALRYRRRPQHAAAAGVRAAAAGEDHVDVGRIVGLALDLVVVGELLAGGDVAQRLDEHAALLDHGLAVRVAAMIDEARLVAIDAGVDDRAPVDDEEERMVVVLVLVVVAPVGLGVRHALAKVLDHACALLDALGGEHAQAVQRRVAHLDARGCAACRAHTATAAVMPA